MTVERKKEMSQPYFHFVKYVAQYYVMIALENTNVNVERND